MLELVESKFLPLALTLLLLPQVVVAHHSHAGFSGEPLEIEGELDSVIWRNPHPVLTLRATDAEGQERLWQIQVLGNVNGLNETVLPAISSWSGSGSHHRSEIDIP